MPGSRVTLVAWIAIGLCAQHVPNRAGDNPKGIRSLIVVRIDREPSGLYLRLRNASSKDLLGYSFSIGASQTNSQWSGTPVIAAGASERIRILNTGLNPGSGQVLIRAALFADGSYEGDAATAAALAIPGMAIDVERRRIAMALEQLISASEPGTGQSLRPSPLHPPTFANVRNSVFWLRTQMDVVSVLEMAERFPPLDDESIRSQFELAARMEKDRFLKKLDEIEKRQNVSLKDTLIQLANEYARESR
jgi:hypothetical protein